MERHIATQYLKEILSKRWTGAVKTGQPAPVWKLKTGHPDLDTFFKKGLPFTVELLGNRSSGKMSLAFRIAQKAVSNDRYLLFVDVSDTFFPPAATLAGIELKSILLAKSGSLPIGLRIAELLVSSKKVGAIIINAGTCKDDLPSTLLRRLQSAAISKQVPTFFLKQQNYVTGDDKRLFPFVLSVRRAMVIPELGLSDPGGNSKNCFVRLKIEASKTGPAGPEVVVNLYENPSNPLPLHPGIPGQPALSQ